MTVGLLSFAGFIGPSGSAQINIGGVDAPGAFINFMKGYGSQSFPAGTDPSNLDANGYPNTTLAGNIGGSIGMPAGYAGNGVNWIVKNTGSRTVRFVINANVTKSASSGGASTTGGSNSVMTVTLTGLGSVTFAFNNYAATNVSFYFPSGFANVSGTGELALVRTSDEAAYDAGTFFTPEFIALLRDLNPKTIRPMGWVNVGNANLSNEVQWRYRVTTATLGWSNSSFPPGVWGGTISGTDAYTIGAATDTPLAGWVDGEVIQGPVTNAATLITISGAVDNGSGLVRLTVNASATLTTNQSVFIGGVKGTIEANGVHAVTVIDGTHVDLQGTSFVHTYIATNGTTERAVVGTQTLAVTGKSGGVKFIASFDGLPMGTNFSPRISSAGTLSTFVYDGLLGVAMWTGSGITSSIPIEAQVQLANTLKTNLWTIIPTWADDTYVSTWATYVRDNLSAALTFYAEYSNEVWNFAFPQTQWAYQRGLALGFPDTSNEPQYGYYGLRVRQTMGIITPIWSGRSNLKRVLAVQAFGSPSQTNLFRLQGSDLASVANGGSGNAAWTSWTGGANYRNSPDRPIDYADVISYASYYSGANFNGGTTYTAASAVFLQSLADNYNSGVPAQIATALADLDNDIRAGLKSAVLGSQTLLGMSNVIYPAWETIAAGYTGKTVQGYEGGLEAIAPTTQQAQAVGISITSTISFNATSGPGTQAVNWTAHGLRNGDRVSFTNSGGALPSGITSGGQCFILNSATDKFDFSSTYYNRTAITPASAGTGTHTALASSGLDNLVEDYKNSTAAQTLVTDQFTQFLGQTHSRNPSWLTITGPNQWALLPGDLFSTPFQTYNGFKAFR